MLNYIKLLTASFLTAQSNDSLTMNEAFNYSVGDTFQYRVNVQLVSEENNVQSINTA